MKRFALAALVVGALALFAPSNANAGGITIQFGVGYGYPGLNYGPRYVPGHYHPPVYHGPTVVPGHIHRNGVYHPPTYIPGHVHPGYYHGPSYRPGYNPYPYNPYNPYRRW